jgi:hypothetical protein
MLRFRRKKDSWEIIMSKVTLKINSLKKKKAFGHFYDSLELVYWKIDFRVFLMALSLFVPFVYLFRLYLI